MLRKLSNNIPSLTLCIRYTTADKILYEAGQATMFTNFQLNHTIVQVCRIQFPHFSQVSQRYRGSPYSTVDHVR